MSGAEFAAMITAAVGAAAVISYVSEHYGEIVLTRTIRRIHVRAALASLHLHITAVCLLFYFHQSNAAKWNALHLIGMDKRALKVFNRCSGIERVDIEADTLFAIYCSEHLIKADNDRFTAEYIRCARAGYDCADILFDHIPEDQRPEPAIADQAAWILHNYGR